MRLRSCYRITLVAAVGFAAISLAQERFDDQVSANMFRAFAGNDSAAQTTSFLTRSSSK